MRFLLGLSIFLCGINGYSSAGLVIHASEFGVGKFHRYDNQQHPYRAASAWSPYILAANASSQNAWVQKNSDGSFAIFYSTLDELLATSVALATQQHLSISVLNVHGHGLPGAMWFPADAKTLQSSDCGDWRNAANGSDSANYDQYYSPVSVDEIKNIRQFSQIIGYPVDCTTGLKEWQSGVTKAPQFKQVLASDAQIHFLSCVVGLGKAGENFTRGLAQLLLGPDGRVVTSTNFGLGDWSMDNGMGFWDYLTDAQVDHDNSIYPVDRKDSEIAQKGTVRVATYRNGQWTTDLVAGQDFMHLGFQAKIRGFVVPETKVTSRHEIPETIRIPGTRIDAQVHH